MTLTRERLHELLHALLGFCCPHERTQPSLHPSGYRKEVCTYCGDVFCMVCTTGTCYCQRDD